MAKAHYTMRKYDAAEAIFEGIRSIDPYRIQDLDTYSNILYVKEKLPELSCLAHSVVEVHIANVYVYAQYIYIHKFVLFR